MAPPLSSLYTLSFLIATLATIFVACTLRLIAILPNARSKTTPLRRKRPLATRVLIVLGSGGHTHEMLHLLRDLDTTKYTHRTYVVSSGDAFSAQRAAQFERELEEKERQKQRGVQDRPVIEDDGDVSKPTMQVTDVNGQTHILDTSKGGERGPACTGPQHYDIAVVPRARKIHQPLLTTPVSALYSLLACFKPLLGAPPGHAPPATPYEAAAADVPDLIITNGPATAVIVILASLILRFFNVKGVDSRDKCKTIYVESFARVKTLSLSGKILLRVVDRFLVQWEELEGAGGRAEYLGVLV